MKGETQEQIVKRIVSFFEILVTKGVSEGIIRQLLLHPDCKTDIDFKSALKAILDLRVEDMLQINGFAKRKATATWTSIQNSIKEVNLAKLQYATGLFNGLGSKKLELLKHFDSKPSVEEVMSIDGFAEKSAQVFVQNCDNFYNFIGDLPITTKQEKTIQTTVEEQDLEGVSFCFTGIRLPEIEEEIVSRGGSIASGVSKKTNYLVTKTKGSGSSKEMEAMQFGTKVLDVEELYSLLK